jgi:hypothetical protein
MVRPPRNGRSAILFFFLRDKVRDEKVKKKR